MAWPLKMLVATKLQTLVKIEGTPPNTNKGLASFKVPLSTLETDEGMHYLDGCGDDFCHFVASVTSSGRMLLEKNECVHGTNDNGQPVEMAEPVKYLRNAISH